MVYIYYERAIDVKTGIEDFSSWAKSFGSHTKSLSGPFITQSNGSDRLPDYFITGNVVTEEKLNG